MTTNNMTFYRESTAILGMPRYPRMRNFSSYLLCMNS